jgi:hypothetical protein
MCHTWKPYTYMEALQAGIPTPGMARAWMLQASCDEPKTRQDVTRIGLSPFLDRWCRRRRRWASWWCGGHRLPAAGALGHVRIIPRRLCTVVPDGGLGLGWGSRRRLGSGGRLDNDRRRVRVWIGIHRGRIPVPYPTHDPPPAEPTCVSPMKPMPAMPDDEIVLMKTTDVAAPDWPCLCRSGEHEARPGYQEYGQK